MILVVSYAGEEHTGDVVQRLEKMGREVLQVDLADFPAKSGIELSWSNGDAPGYVLNNGGAPIDLKRTRVAWWRRVRPFTPDPEISPTYVPFAISETSQAINGMLDALPCVWINNRGADDAAHHKPYQWEIAHQVGLSLPRTMVTNRPDAARNFINATGVGNTVFKAFLASIEEWRETRLIEPGDLDHLDLVKHAPVIFQEYIKGVDLRITAVGGRLFPGEIDARNTSYPVDMRMVIGEAGIQQVKLPSKVTKMLLELMRRLGLTYGAIDMRRTAEGEYYFLEVNPAGQWLFVEQRTGMPISQAVADLLAGYDAA